MHALAATLDALMLRARLAKRRLSGVDGGLMGHYMRGTICRKLHIGCGLHLLPGWLNADFLPSSSSVMHLDATQPFPFADDQFAFAFSEHMIEHVDFRDGQRMLAEVYRVLRPGGVVRIATPDLAFLVELGDPHCSSSHRRYVEWATKTLLPAAPFADASFVVNHFMRSWGHRFIYSDRTLRHALAEAGFDRIARLELCVSEHSELCKLENEDRMPEGFLKLETMVFEGTKESGA